MPSIKLDLVNYVNDDGSISGDLLHSWTKELDVTFDETEVRDGAPHTLEFTGSIDDLHELLNRYEDDPDTRLELRGYIR